MNRVRRLSTPVGVLCASRSFSYSPTKINTNTNRYYKYRLVFSVAAMGGIHSAKATLISVIVTNLEFGV